MRVIFEIPKELLKGKRKQKYKIGKKEITAIMGVFIPNGDYYSWIFDHICYEGENCGVPDVLNAKRESVITPYTRYSRRYGDWTTKYAFTYKTNTKLKRLFLKAVKLLKENKDKVKIIIEPSNFGDEFLEAFEVALFVRGLGIEDMNIETTVDFRKYLPYIEPFLKESWLSYTSPAIYQIKEVLSTAKYKSTKLFTVKMRAYYEYAKNKYYGEIIEKNIGFDFKKNVLIKSSDPIPKVIYSLIHGTDERDYPEIYKNKSRLPNFTTITQDLRIVSYHRNPPDLRVNDDLSIDYIATYEIREDRDNVGEHTITIAKNVKIKPIVKRNELYVEVIKDGKSIDDVYMGIEVENKLKELIEKTDNVILDKSESFKSRETRLGYEYDSEIYEIKLNGKPTKGGINGYLRHLQIFEEVKAGDVITVKPSWLKKEYRLLVLAVKKDVGGFALDLDGLMFDIRSYNTITPIWVIYP